MLKIDYQLQMKYNKRIQELCDTLDITLSQAKRDFDEFVDDTHHFSIELMGFEYSPSEVFKHSGGTDYYDEFILFLAWRVA